MTHGPDAPAETRRVSRSVFAEAGLIRPRARSRVAGVCASFGDGTGTDPLLWRVIFAVLVAFGGLGIVLYAVGWLLFPGDHDDASAIEALFGRGRSRTSRLVAAALFLGVLFGGTLVLLRNAGWPLVLTGLLGLAVIGLSRQRAVAPLPADEPTSTAFAPHGPFPTGASAAGTDDGDTPDRTRVLDEESQYTPSGTRIVGTAPLTAPTTVEGTVAAARRRFRQRLDSIVSNRSASSAPAEPAGSMPATRVDNAWRRWNSRFFRTAQREPRSSPAAPKGDAGVAPGRSEKRRRRNRQPDRPPAPSRAGRVTVLLMFIAAAVLLVIAATPVDMPLSLFASVLLGVCGLGLVVASRRGGSSGLSWLGTGLAVVLVVTIGIDRVGPIGFQSYTMSHPDDVPEKLDASFGETTLDVSTVAFTEIPGTIAVTVTAAHMTIVVPADVDVVVNIDGIVFGSVYLDANKVGGASASGQTLFSDGPDGPGGGSLTIDADVRLGTVEIIR